ncbi:MAG TPA: rhomboid family intramembrane serine protease [Anaerolineales bacterium]|jgi:membrane associated rhomboid family serine protease|nr:rhomboid family intramembrane serine protease [Anaerolineales bacterium]
MMPLGDDNSGRRLTPIVTYALIAINVLVFLLELTGGDAFIQRWAFVPTRFLENPAGDFATLFTSMFMHAGWLHLLGNMLYLWIFGDNVEDRLGHALYFVFYILCGLAATFAQFVFSMNSSIPNLGASGAIAGVLGAYLIMFPRGSVNVLIGRVVTRTSALIAIGFWFLLQLFSQVSAFSASSQSEGGVAYMAHIGGFIAGVVLTFLLGGNRRALPSTTSYRRS